MHHMFLTHNNSNKMLPGDNNIQRGGNKIKKNSDQATQNCGFVRLKWSVTFKKRGDIVTLSFLRLSSQDPIICLVH